MRLYVVSLTGPVVITPNERCNHCGRRHGRATLMGRFITRRHRVIASRTRAALLKWLPEAWHRNVVRREHRGRYYDLAASIAQNRDVFHTAQEVS